MSRVLLTFAIVLSLAACQPWTAGTKYPGTSVYIWHDDEHSVTCWIYSAPYKGGISCLTDRELSK